MIVAFPTFSAVTFPASSTLSTVSSDVVHIIVTSFASVGSTFAVTVVSSPTFSFLLSAVTVTLLSSGVGSGFTSSSTSISTLSVTFFSPCTAVAVIVAFPAFSAVTFPASSTLSTVASDVFHVIVTSFASVGSTFAVTVVSSPTFSFLLSAVTVTLLSSGVGSGFGFRFSSFSVSAFNASAFSETLWFNAYAFSYADSASIYAAKNSLYFSSPYWIPYSFNLSSAALSVSFKWSLFTVSYASNSLNWNVPSTPCILI